MLKPGKQICASLIICICITVVNSGCATFVSLPLSPEQNLCSFENRTLDDPGLKQFIETECGRKLESWPPRNWDLELLGMAACYYHSDLQIARARSDLAEAGVITAGQFPNPTLSLGPQYDFTPQGSVTPWTLPLSIELPIETAGRRKYRLAQATNLSTAAQLGTRSAAWQIRSRVRKSILDFYFATCSAQVLKENLELQEEIVQLLTQRLTSGEISQPEFDQGRIPRDQAKLSLAEAQKQIALGRARLAQAMGLPEMALRGIKLSFSALEGFPSNLPLAELRKKALLSRPDLLSFLAKYEAAQSALQLEIAGQYPNVSIGPGYEYDEGENKWSVGITVALPVFNRNQGPIAEAKARRKEASAKFVAFQANLIGTIDEAVVNYSKSHAILETADSILKEQQATEKSTQARFEAGDLDRLGLLGAKLGVNAASQARLQAYYAAQQSLGLLEDSFMHTLWPR